MTENSSAENSDVRQRLINQLPAMVGYWDADCRNIAANTAYEEWFGFGPDRIHGAHISDVLGESVYALNLPYIHGVLQGETQLFDRTLTDTFGRVRHTQTTYIPDISDGRVVGFFVLVTEVTARVEAEMAAAEAIEEYRSLARSLPGSFVMLFDAQLKYLIAEGSSLKDFDLERDQVEGRSLWEVLPDHADELEERYRSALSGHLSQWTRSVNGRVFEMTAAPATTESGDVIAGMVIGRDITERRRLEVTGVALQNLALAAARRAPLDEIVELVAQSALELLEGDNAGVVRFDPDGMRILSLAPDAGLIGGLLRDSEGTAAALVAQSGSAQLIEDADGGIGRATLSGLKLRSSAAAPIWVGQRLWGSIGVGVRSQFEDKVATIKLLQDFADLVSLAISNNEAWAELDRKAHRDSLTSLPNRRVFEEQLSLECRRATASAASIAVVIIDLDFFKMVNDVYGHQVGDAVLVEAATRLQATRRGDELISRIGGEEFAAVLYDCPPSQLEAACERFRRVINDRPFSRGIQLSASVGAASRRGAPDPATLTRLADNALYEAKNAGRNRISLDVQSEG